MIFEIALRYVHFVSIFAIFGSLSSELFLLGKTLSRKEIRRIAKIDAIYGIAALILLAAGLTLWLGSVGKPSYFYSKNWIFYIKITLFVLIGIISIWPTIFFIKNKKGNESEIVQVPTSVFMMLRIELLLLLIIPLLAGLMTKGIGYFG